MKRVTVFIMLVIFAVAILGGCKKEADMMETMASEIVSDVESIGDDTTGHSGEVTDDDGVIGNEAEENSTMNNTNSDTSGTSASDNVLS